MLHKFHVASKQDGDGSISVWIVNTVEEAYEKLERPVHSDLDGYEDGEINPIELDLDSDGKLLKPVYKNFF